IGTGTTSVKDQIMQSGEGDFGSQIDRPILRREQQAADTGKSQSPPRRTRSNSIDGKEAEIDRAVSGRHCRVPGQLQRIKFEAGAVRITNYPCVESAR